MRGQSSPDLLIKKNPGGVFTRYLKKNETRRVVTAGMSIASMLGTTAKHVEESSGSESDVDVAATVEDVHFPTLDHYSSCESDSESESDHDDCAAESSSHVRESVEAFLSVADMLGTANTIVLFVCYLVCLKFDSCVCLPNHFRTSVLQCCGC